MESRKQVNHGMRSIEDLVKEFGSRQNVWNYLFEYREGQLFWKNPRAPRIKPGALAGNLNTRYFSVFVCGKTVYLHKIIYEMHHGDYEGEVDHEDTDSLNNKIANLRPATRLENVRNVGVRKDNKLGSKGVHLNKAGKYIAQINLEKGKRKYLGSFETEELASECYRLAAKEAYGAFFHKVTANET